jgi:ABC-type bacteriocin/lantibiotic exporter with double-glycine peptidase domain
MITTGMLVVGGVLLVQNKINIGQFVASEILILTVLSAVEKLIQSLDKVYDVLTSIDKLGKVLDKPLESKGTYQLPDLAAVTVSMQQVQFGYQPESPVLKNISFELNAGEKMCLMGAAGSGKSTILRLLTGSYSNFEGVILINGIPLSNYDTHQLRGEIGILFSQQDIFQGTLLENITLGNPQVKASDIVTLSEKLGLENVIASFKSGFDTLVDPLGNRLSGTVVRKILLLRALIGNPILLLLEEPWMGFDEKTTDRIRKYILEELPNTTVLVAANDSSFAAQCQRVLVVQEGSNAKYGKPADIFK